MAQVPTLEIVEDDGAHALTQSLPILEYLEERCPTPPLLPRDPLAARAGPRSSPRSSTRASSRCRT